MTDGRILGAGLRQLDPSRPYKPLDVAESGVSVSVNHRGRLTAIVARHPYRGMVVVDALRGLAYAERFDAQAVRRYRQRLAARRSPSFGLRVAGGSIGSAGSSPVPRRTPAWLLADALPVTAGPDGRPGLVTLVPHLDDADGALGVVQVFVDDGGAIRKEGSDSWDADVRIAEADYPELTEVRPRPFEAPAAALTREPGRFVVENPSLPWAMAIQNGRLVEGRVRGGRARIRAVVDRGLGMVVIGLGLDRLQAIRHAEAIAARGAEMLLTQGLRRWEARWARWPAPLIDGPVLQLARRALGYGLTACAVPVADTVCLVADHRILPLSWTRDGYWLARALLDWAAAGGPSEAVEVVRRHVHWLFSVAERPSGWWGRSHLVHGPMKDPVFQLDQQLYPLLELAEYVALTGDRQLLASFEAEIGRVLRVIDARRAPDGTPLFATDETAADDPVRLPYLTANQILAWHTFRSLDALGLGAGALADLAEAVRRAVRDRLVMELEPGRSVFAYGTDLAGRYEWYHDANDLPLAFASQWGYCRTDDPVWRATIEAAFGPHNEAFFPGRFGGLGSRHTPAPWPLGAVQLLHLAPCSDDEGLAARVRGWLAAASYWDGALPEAVAAEDGRPISRPWFAWPGAALVHVELAAAGRALAQGQARP